MVKVNLLLNGDVSVRELYVPFAVGDAVKLLGAGVAKTAYAVKIDGVVRDLRTVIDKDGAEVNVELLTFDVDEGRRAYNHTASHILAQAVKRLYPDVKLAIGPAIKDGFYYDFDVVTPFTTEQLTEIEAEMKKIVKENLPIEQYYLPPTEALNALAEQGEPYKVELAKEHADKGEDISFYKQGEFVDLCAGPHVAATGVIKAFKLTSVTGAYWRGDEHNKMLSRIYGTAFPKQSLLDEHLAKIEEAKKRDHRKIGAELGLFTILDEGPGFPFFLPDGMTLKTKLIDYWREIHAANDYKEISTPIMLNRSLWERSGHWEHYKDNMYATKIDEVDFAVKPMNCPGSILVYANKPHSYRELPLRYAELGLVHRHEKSGALHGLMRVRCFTQDDAHIFLAKDQIKDEIKRIVTIIDKFYNVFGFKYSIELSTMPDDHMGDIADWEQAENGLKDALDDLGLKYEINAGDGAFYGPKIDFHLEDCIGRTWQCGTIQLDFQLPERFELEYTGADGAKHRPVMIHRVVFGSVERFIGILTEHFAGAFPLWLSPKQVQIIPITDRTNEYAAKLLTALETAGIRADIDTRNEKMNLKIREAQLAKIPYMFVVGDEEERDNTIAVRTRTGTGGGKFALADIVEKISAEIRDKG
ncbi:MAG: threonine--tRNA ligase [Oscillospiraceae bacterium]|jgi:threonyl-tRNA synthetase|nr:threonine--tRNA ligase [Oscillospiraceae bacterium]